MASMYRRNNRKIASQNVCGGMEREQFQELEAREPMDGGRAMTASKKHKSDPIIEARKRLARFNGGLSRWAGLTGNAPPADCKDHEAYLIDAFSAWLSQLDAQRRE